MAKSLAAIAFAVAVAIVFGSGMPTFQKQGLIGGSIPQSWIHSAKAIAQ